MISWQQRIRIRVVRFQREQSKSLPIIAYIFNVIDRANLGDNSYIRSGRCRAQGLSLNVSWSVQWMSLKNTLLMDHIVKPYSIGTERSRCDCLVWQFLPQPSATSKVKHWKRAPGSRVLPSKQGEKWKLIARRFWYNRIPRSWESVFKLDIDTHPTNLTRIALVIRSYERILR